MPHKEEPDRLKSAREVYLAAQDAKASGDIAAMADKLNELGAILTAPAPSIVLKDLPKLSAFAMVEWDEPHTFAAIALAEGKTQEQAGEEVGVTGRTIRNWLQNENFSSEVDRLSLMLGIASRAERLRLAKRVVREKTIGNKLQTDKDVLEWLKFAQSETDGAKIDFTKLTAAFAEAETPVANSRSGGTFGETESKATN